MSTEISPLDVLYTVDCPECEWGFQVESPQRDEVIQCADCNLRFIVVAVDDENKSISLELTEADADDWGQ